MVIENASPLVVNAMIEYMYVSEVRDDADALDLLHLADQYEVEGLLSLCGSLLISKLTEENVAAAVKALQPLRSRDTLTAIWDKLLMRIREDDKLFRQVMSTM